MSNTKVVIYAAIVCLVLAGLYLMRRHFDKRVDGQIVSTVLAPSDQEKLIVDTRHHTITEVTRNEKGRTVAHKTFLPTTASIEVHKDGTVKVVGRSYGTEVALSVGVLYGTDFKLRGALSLGLLYFERCELGIGLGVASSLTDTRVLVDATYNAYDNLQIGGYVDNQRHAGVIALLRF